MTGTIQLQAIPVPKISRSFRLVFVVLAIGACDESSEPQGAISDPPPLILEEPSPTPDGMVWIPGGTFMMGSEQYHSDEKPVHEVSVDGFWMDQTEVTNRKFSEFVKETGYVTVAEKFGNSVTFLGAENSSIDSVLQLWELRDGASWRSPGGPSSSIAGLEDHPVVHVAWDDVNAYCKWAGRSLPTEAEWEYAARGGDAKSIYPWGSELRPDGKFRMNSWQGEFPYSNSVEDSFRTTAPAMSFSPNAYGLYDMSGNVWEWCADFYHYYSYANSESRNPRGADQSYDPQEPDAVKRVIRGGSYLCSENYCTGYRVTARMKTAEDTGLCHTGFRTVKRATDASR